MDDIPKLKNVREVLSAEFIMVYCTFKKSLKGQEKYT